MRRYLEYTTKLARDYGSVMNFVLKERLRWTDLTPQGEIPFSNAGTSFAGLVLLVITRKGMFD